MGFENVPGLTGRGIFEVEPRGGGKRDPEEGSIEPLIRAGSFNPWTALAQTGLSLVSNALNAEGQRDARRQAEDAAEVQARALEEQARLSAQAEREKSLKLADQAREDAQRRRGRSTARWGVANLAMEGTPLTLAEADRAADEERVQDVLDQGLDAESRILSLGGQRAAAARARAKASSPAAKPQLSTLLGQGGGLFGPPLVLW